MGRFFRLPLGVWTERSLTFIQLHMPILSPAGGGERRGESRCIGLCVNPKFPEQPSPHLAPPVPQDCLPSAKIRAAGHWLNQDFTVNPARCSVLLKPARSIEFLTSGAIEINKTGCATYRPRISQRLPPRTVYSTSCDYDVWGQQRTRELVRWRSCLQVLLLSELKVVD